MESVASGAGPVKGQDAGKSPAIDTSFLSTEEIGEEVVLYRRAENALLERLQRLEDAAIIFKRRAELIEACQLAALRRTRPQDWVLFRESTTGVITALLAGPGADLVSEVYGIVIPTIGPTNEKGEFAPVRINYSSGAYGLRGFCSAYSRVNGRSIEYLEATIRSDEDFTGRQIDAKGSLVRGRGKEASEEDLRSSLLTRLRSKVARVLGGMTRVPVAELDRAWKDTDKHSADCRKGSGYGSSSERKAAEVADADVPQEREIFRKAIRQLVGGDPEAERQLCREVTSNAEAKDAAGKPKPFAGHDSADRFTKGWQIERAWERLMAHPAFGEDAKRIRSNPRGIEPREAGQED